MTALMAWFQRNLNQEYTNTALNLNVIKTEIWKNYQTQSHTFNKYSTNQAVHRMNSNLNLLINSKLELQITLYLHINR